MTKTDPEKELAAQRGRRDSVPSGLQGILLFQRKNRATINYINNNSDLRDHLADTTRIKIER